MSVTRKERRFHAGVEVFRRLTGRTEEEYACPICGTPHPIGSLNTAGPCESPRLTEDHVPPKAVGGRKLVLTCRVCNNTAGHREELHLEPSLALTNLLRGSGPVRPIHATFSVGDVVQHGTLVRGPDGIPDFKRDPTRNNPAHTQAFPSAFAETTTATLKIDEAADAGQAALAMARAAYLATFAFFGYCYVWQPAMHPLRQELVYRTRQFRPPVLRTTSSVDLGVRGIGILRQPEWLCEAVAVVMGSDMVLLPSVNGSDVFAEVDGHRRRAAPLGAYEFEVMFPWPTEPVYKLDRIALGDVKSS